ncbi:MAG: hypothetical protein A3I05_05430 [Deltaproteobacteria bacterium RIFCSPLOWO2_02_FULL_44_10]|nr:MAG: hypothetical protein A3C46_06180 [Deltaproteobacteria bacterium RIFCSPHIGHO2_02_FULL_44_16]OGQ46028.1 MAG: hypothetical protein A3I05_05430 [Deltaproteobacteria bacterium RIFCSPLOWO2_02_FULL_44_10]
MKHFFTMLGIFFSLKRILIAGAVGIFFGFLLLGDQGVYQLTRLLEMKHSLLSKRKELQQKIKELETEQTLLQEPKNLEMVVREELGLIKPGEILFQERPRLDRKGETADLH